MTKQELAIRYFPQWKKTKDRQKASHKLGVWMRSCQPLQEALAQTGYRQKQKELTPTQVGLIMEYLGEP